MSFLACSAVEFISKWKHSFFLAMEINAGMSFLEMHHLKNTTVMNRRYTLKIFTSLILALEK
jgi:hypothetical protein